MQINRVTGNALVSIQNQFCSHFFHRYSDILQKCPFLKVFVKYKTKGANVFMIILDCGIFSTKQRVFLGCGFDDILSGSCLYLEELGLQKLKVVH